MDFPVGKTIKLYLGNLSFDTTEDDIAKVVQQCGQLTTCTIRRRQDNNKSRGFGHIGFRYEEECLKAFQVLHNKEINGRIVRVDWCDNYYRQKYPHVGCQAFKYREEGMRSSAVSKVDHSLSMHASMNPLEAKQRIPPMSDVLGGHLAESSSARDTIEILSPECHLTDLFQKLCTTLTMSDVLSIMAIIQQQVVRWPDVARKILRDIPQLRYAVLHAQSVIGILKVDFEALPIEKLRAAIDFQKFYTSLQQKAEVATSVDSSLGETEPRPSERRMELGNISESKISFSHGSRLPSSTPSSLSTHRLDTLQQLPLGLRLQFHASSSAVPFSNVDASTPTSHRGKEGLITTSQTFSSLLSAPTPLKTHQGNIAVSVEESKSMILSSAPPMEPCGLPLSSSTPREQLSLPRSTDSGASGLGASLSAKGNEAYFLPLHPPKPSVSSFIRENEDAQEEAMPSRFNTVVSHPLAHPPFEESAEGSSFSTAKEIATPLLLSQMTLPTPLSGSTTLSEKMSSSATEPRPPVLSPSLEDEAIPLVSAPVVMGVIRNKALLENITKATPSTIAQWPQKERMEVLSIRRALQARGYTLAHD